MKIQKSFLLLISIVLILQSCAVNPVTGKKELMLISESGEINMGRNIDRSIKIEYGIYPDPELNRYVREVGQMLTLHCHRKNLSYQFAVLDTPVVNAFAAPGGYIYITRGLLALLNSEAELAVILGHELGHVNARHSARSISRNILLYTGLAIAGELSKDIRELTPLLMVSSQLLFLKYSRKDEYQADFLGIQYSRAAGYSSGKMIDFFLSLRRMEKVASGSRLPNFLSTHPLTEKRISKVDELLKPEDRKLRVKRDNYLMRINNLTYGSNPLHGYVRNRKYVNPSRGISFRIPSGWKYQYTPRMFTMVSADQKSMMRVTFTDNGEDIITHTNTLGREYKNSKTISQGYRNSNEFRSYYKDMEVLPANSDENTVPVRVILNSFKRGNAISTATVLSSQQTYNAHRDDINFTLNSFRTFRGNIQSIRPLRVKTVKIRRAETLNSFLTRNNIRKNLRGKIAHMNSIDLNTVLKRNSLIKILSRN